MAAQNLVVLFVTTSGQNAELLGSDEEQIVSFVYLLFDVTNNRVVALHQHYVRPIFEDNSELTLSEECKLQTGLTEEPIKNGQPLEHVLDEFDRFLSAKNIHPDHGGKPFCFCTDGSLHQRLCIHPESIRKNFTLPQYYFKFFNLRQEFKQKYGVKSVNCIKDMLDYLSIEQDQTVEYGVRQCQEMARIITRLLNDGHEFRTPEVVKEKLEPGICSSNDLVDDDTVIRARGLPWQSSDQDIARFFRGLNVAKGGVALCLSQQGRRNGEALIRFETKENRDLALRKHKHHLGQRYIEVYPASGKDFVSVAGGSNTEAHAFLSRHSGEGMQIIVRMRGLPYSCTSEQVMEFFRSGDHPVEVLDSEEGILFVHQADGRATGDAFVLFSSDDDASKALSKHRECIGSRYIELFKSTTAEVQQVLNRSMDPRTPPEPQQSELPPLIHQLPQPPMFLPQQLITSGTIRDCIRLRGLPFEATVQDILTFLGEHARNIVFQGVHMVFNAQGTPSGEAFIQMEGEQASEIAALTKHKKFMFMGNKKRYIEVIQCSGEDMNLVLTNGITSQMPPQLTPQTMLPPTPPMMPGLPGLAGLPQLQRAMLPQSAVELRKMTTSSPGQLDRFWSLPNVSQYAGALQAAGGLPGQTVMPPTPSLAAAALAMNNSLANQVVYTAASGMYPYAQMPQPIMTQPGTTLMQPYGMAGLTHGMGPRPALTPQLGQYPTAQGTAGNQQILYWYPSPPVSPQSSYYVHASPTTVVVKGLPFTIQAPDILSFLEGIYEMTPDVQLQRSADGRPTGEAYITFGSRVEAERAVTERNRKIIGNRVVEMHMA